MSSYNFGQVNPLTMNQQKWVEILSRINSGSVQSNSVQAEFTHTSYELCTDILNQVTLRGDVCVVSNPEWLLCDVDYSKINSITFVTDCNLKHRYVTALANKYNIAVKIVSMDMLLEGKINMKFDVVVGNPPFNGSKNDIDGSRAKQLYKDFVTKSLTLADNVYMVMPSLWTHKTGTLKTELYNFGLKKCASCSDKFTVDIGICYIIAEKGYKGNLTVKPNAGNEYEIVWNDKTAIHLNSSEDRNNILDKIKSKFNLGNIWARSSLNRNDPTIGSGSTKVIDITGPVTTLPEIISTTKNESEFPGFNSWKVITNNVLGSPKIGVTKAIGPGVGTTYSVVVLLVQNEIEANNLKSYIDSKFVSFIVKCIKNNGANSKVLFSNIPSLDFSKKWSDSMIYEHFGLTQKEIDYVEDNVK